MGITIYKTFAVFIILFSSIIQSFGQSSASTAIIIRSGIDGNKISMEWRNALQSRMSKSRLDSFTNLRREVSDEEHKWRKLIESKAARWNGFRDSLKLIFGNTYIHDTVYVMLGYLGNDDGFTFGYQTVCLDLTALHRAYGSADLPVNDNRIDRVFSHEYTHVLHKEWARQNKLVLTSFKDSILWECLYEGIGMYRSLSAKWLPVNDTIPQITKQAIEALAPVFVERIVAVHSKQFFREDEKAQLNAGLSRGAVDKKWGAFPVGIWLAQEAKGDERKLVEWIDKGPEAVILLARKYLEGEAKLKFEKFFLQ